MPNCEAFQDILVQVARIRQPILFWPRSFNMPCKPPAFSDRESITSAKRNLLSFGITKVSIRQGRLEIMATAYLFAFCLVTSGFSQTTWEPTAPQSQAMELVGEEVIRSHIRFLADDLLEGRGPGSRGDELTQLYISTEFESLGLKPAGLDGGWLQPVPLRGITSIPPKQIELVGAGETMTLKSHDEVILVSGRKDSHVSLKGAELVFVGFGIQAPEFEWDDFKDLDVRGKILVVMNNDPEDDPELFAGKKRLYYGRWDYKYAMAAKLGAAGALIIHTDDSAGYPFQVIQTGWTGEEFELAQDEGSRTNLKGWLTDKAAHSVFQWAGLDLDKLRATASQREFKPVPLGVKLSVEFDAVVREQKSANVLAKLEGSDPVLKDQHVIFMAHHDHLGLAAGRDASGDNIYNGAIDNASGTATMLAIARAIANSKISPKRSILFAAVAAEEQGLLGSKHFATYPTIPPGKLAAVVNIDGINFLGRTHDVNLVGNGKNTLDALVQNVTTWQGRTLVPELNPERGYYYRSDQFSLAKIGVPGVYLHGGVNIVGKPSGWGKEQLDAWIDKVYHQPSDEFDPNWNLSGAIEDARLLMLVGLLIADQPDLPQWLPGDEFEAARKAAISAVE